MIRLDRGPLSPEPDGALLAEMAARIAHAGGERVDQWTDFARGFAIARVRPGHLDALPWPASAQDPHTPAIFVDGVIHGDPPLGPIAAAEDAPFADLEGFFSAARWDPIARRAVIATDRRASRPVAYAVSRGVLYFAPEPKALLAVPGLPRTLDLAAAGVFLGAGYLLAHQTLIASVRRLAGGEALVVGDRGVRVAPYWRFQLRARGDGTSAEDLEAELQGAIRGAVLRNLPDPETTVVFLSGGVDSRAIAAIAGEDLAARGATLRTMTWSSPSPRTGSDRPIAARVAGALGARHDLVTRGVDGYAAAFARLNYALDALTDVAAYHPQELGIMRRLAASGVRAVVRGDECFGWAPEVESADDALTSLNLRRPARLGMVARILRPAAGRSIAEAANVALDAAIRPFLDDPPDDARDHLYFRHRLQGYLQPAAYMKQIYLDHRAPLLDERILALTGRVPAKLRLDKALFQRCARAMAPAIFRIPLAGEGNLEDWPLLIASRSPVRRVLEHELADAESGIWDLVDRRAAIDLLPPIGAGSRPRRPAAAALASARIAARRAIAAVPPVARRVQIARARANIRADQVLFRLLVLKSFHDLFLAGDGGRAAFDAALARAAEIDAQRDP